MTMMSSASNRNNKNKNNGTIDTINNNNNKEKNKNKKKNTTKQNQTGNNGTPSAVVNNSRSTICPSSIKGTDDAGIYYNSHEELQRVQEHRKEEFYQANNNYWSTGGYGGLTDEEAMIGDTGGIQDGEEGLLFLDKLLAYAAAAAAPGSSSLSNTTKTNTKTNNKGKNKDGKDNQRNNNNHTTSCFNNKNDYLNVPPHNSKYRFENAVDLGAGVGRITKHILLKRYDSVRLVEADGGWSKRSKVYLGRKRASRCCFDNSRLDSLTPANILNWSDDGGGIGIGGTGGGSVDLMWIQWTLQYLTDNDVVDCLRIISQGLRSGSGILVVKENRPYGMARDDRFQMEVPDGSNLNHRYDITRSDLHHRYLFQMAGLRVAIVERGVETNTYALQNNPQSNNNSGHYN